jgi:hypothetical protein
MKSVIIRFLNSPFHSKGQLFVFLLVTSYLLLAINSGWGFFGIIIRPDFVPALVFTFSMAFLLSGYLHETNHHLEKKYPLRRNRKKRLFLHLLFGIVIPVSFELISAQIFFSFKKESIFTNSFFDIDFILIVVFLFSMNVYYVWAHNLNQYKIKVKQLFNQTYKPALNDLEKLKNLYRLKLIKEAPVSITDISIIELGIFKTQIACAYRLNNITTIHYFDHTTEIVATSIARLRKDLPYEDYFQINPYCFYHRLVIFEYNGRPSRRLRLTLRHPFNTFLHEHQRMVSQSNYSKFKAWFKLKS